MKLFTINEFAAKHKVTRVAIETAMREGRLEFVREHGKRLLPKQPYKPIKGRGRKPGKK